MEGLGSKKSKQHQRQAEWLTADTSYHDGSSDTAEFWLSCLAHKQIRLPFAFHRSHHVLDKGDVVWAEGTEEQSHPRFIRRAVPFAVVAPDAGTNQILPSIAATA